MHALAAAGLGLIVGLAAMAPALVRPGWLLLLDWVSGPRLRFPEEAYGMNGGLVYGDFSILQWAVAQVVGGDITQWLLPMLCFPLAAVAVARLVGGSLARQLPAAFLYMVNPFLLERLGTGQISFVAAYAVLPFVASAVISAVRGHTRAAVIAGAWIAAGTAVVIHTAWLALVLLVVAVFVLGVHQQRAVLRRLAALGLVAAAIGAHLWLPQLVNGPARAAVVEEVAAFRTRGGPGAGVALELLGLYGFWRPSVPLLRDMTPAWGVVVLALVLMVVAGVVSGLRSPERRSRDVTMVVAVAGAVGYILALGDRGPLGGLFATFVLRVPAGGVMREPQKFLALTALLYSVGFGLAVESSLRRVAGASKVASAVPLLAVALVATPNFFFGLAGHLEVSRFPDSWARADQAMGSGTGKVLVLPWHRFLGFDFTGGRSVRHPATHYFQRDAIVGDNIEVGALESLSVERRSRYLEYLYDRGPTLSSFGALVAPLAVEYVFVSKTADWRDYGWLARQPDLDLVFETHDSLLYRNTAPFAPGATEAAVIDSWDDAIASSREAPPRAATVFATDAAVARAEPRAVTTPEASIREVSPRRYAVEGPARVVAVPEVMDARWRLGGRSPQETAWGTMYFVRHQEGPTPLEGSVAFVSVVTTVAWVVSGLGLFGLVLFLRTSRFERSSLDTVMQQANDPQAPKGTP